MASEDASNPMAESGVTMRSDSEQYSPAEELSASPPESSSPPLVLYRPPTVWSLIRGAAINLFLPFIIGMMLGFGELFAHEAAFRLGWGGTRVSGPRLSKPGCSVPTVLRRRRGGAGLGVVSQRLTQFPRCSRYRGNERIPSVQALRLWIVHRSGPTCKT